jgi:hypothetical protein
MLPMPWPKKGVHKAAVNVWPRSSISGTIVSGRALTALLVAFAVLGLGKEKH